MTQQAIRQPQQQDAMTLDRLGKQQVTDEFSVNDLQSMCSFTMEDPDEITQEMLDTYLAKKTGASSCVIIKSPLSDKPEFTVFPEDQMQRGLIARTWHTKTKELLGKYIVSLTFTPNVTLKDFFNQAMADDQVATFVSLYIYYRFAASLRPYGFDPLLCVLHRGDLGNKRETEATHYHYVLVSEIETRSSTYKKFMREYGDNFVF